MKIGLCPKGGRVLADWFDAHTPAVIFGLALAILAQPIAAYWNHFTKRQRLTRWGQLGEWFIVLLVVAIAMTLYRASFQNAERQLAPKAASPTTLRATPAPHATGPRSLTFDDQTAIAGTMATYRGMKADVGSKQEDQEAKAFADSIALALERGGLTVTQRAAGIASGGDVPLMVIVNPADSAAGQAFSNVLAQRGFGARFQQSSSVTQGTLLVYIGGNI